MNFTKSITIIIGSVLYLLTAGASYAAFSYFQPTLLTSLVQTKESAKKTTTTTAPVNKYANLPKTEPCPLNGALYSQPERQLWEARRPLGVMIENSKEARPQSGLSSADVVYEAVAEGGITRFMAVFYCQDADFVGPVRSARTYYLDWISEYADFPLYAHVGGANTSGPADALGQIEKYGWSFYNDLNQFSVPFPYMWRDLDRLKGAATEHTVYSATGKLWTYAADKRKLTNVAIDPTTGKTVPWNATFAPWSFKDDAAVSARPSQFAAEFNFSNTASSYISDYLVRWQYDHDSNSYLRFAGGAEQRDLNTNQQLLAKNVVLLYMQMGIADDSYAEEGHGLHTLYTDKGTGAAKFLIDGKVIDGTWSKKTRIDRTRFFDSKGLELKLNRGLTWIEILPIGQKVTII